MKKKKAMPISITKPYTVILILPDTVAENYGEEFYIGRVNAEDPREALAIARAGALKAYGLPEAADEEAEGWCDPVDFACVAVFEGRHKDLNPET